MYYCQMPGCDYSCEDKSQINFHHIVPRELGGNNKKSNLVELCPNCHAKVYIPEATSGNHSIKHDNSIILLKKLLSTGGTVIAYQEIGNNEVKYVKERDGAYERNG